MPYTSATMKKIPTKKETTVFTMLNPILHPFKLLSVGRFADNTPMIPESMIQSPNQIPDPLLFTQ